MKESSTVPTNKEAFSRSLVPRRIPSSIARIFLLSFGHVALLPLFFLVDPVKSFLVEQRMLHSNHAVVVAAKTSFILRHERASRSFLTGRPVTSTNLACSAGSSSSSSEPPSPSAGAVRFLGQGPRAIVREGSVLVAPQHEYHHYYRQSAIFVYDMGEDEKQEGMYVIRGLILDHPTPFTLREMIPGKFDDSELGESLLFRGGDKGGDGVVLLHSRPELGQAEIGAGSGIYQGGWDAALTAMDAGAADGDDFKAFFNYCEFSEDELEELLDSQEDGDGWASVEVGYDIVLDKDWGRGECWKRLRNAVSQQMRA